MAELDLDLTMLLVEKKAELQLKKERRKLRTENGIAFYKPHPKQDLFHRNGHYKRRYARTGNRFGKSDMGAAEDVAFALGERPWYPESDPARTTGIPKYSTKGCIVVQSWEKASEIFTNRNPGTSLGKLFKLLPKSSIVDVIKSRSGGGIGEIIVKSIYGGLSTIHMQTVRSYMLNNLSVESSDWDWIHVDEPCPEGMWVALSRGLTDRGGSAWFTCTPLTEMWINDYFIPSSLTRATFDEGYVNDTKETARFIMTGSIRDNIYLDEKNIRAFLDDVPPEQLACREQGIPLSMSGLIYKSFDHNLHIYSECPYGWSASDDPPADYTVRLQIDPHPRTANAIQYFATSPQGYTFIYKEYFVPGLASDLVEAVLAEMAIRSIELIELDPIAWSTDPVHAGCIADEFAEAGIDIFPAPKQLAFGIIKTNAKFRERDKFGKPTIYVHKDCERWLWEINRYIWKPETEKPIDKDDHMMETLYRGVLTGLTYVSPISYKMNLKQLVITSDSWQKNSNILEYTPKFTDHL